MPNVEGCSIPSEYAGLPYEVALAWMQLLTGANYLGTTKFTLLLYPDGSQKVVYGGSDAVLTYLTAEAADQSSGISER